MNRAAVETEIVRRLGPWMAKAGLAVTTAGSNADLASPIAWAVRQAGGTVADPTAPTSDEVGAITDADKLFALAEYRTLQNTYQAYTGVDVSAGAVSAKNDQLRQAMKERLAELKAYLRAEYDIGVTFTGAAVSGAIANQAVW